MLSKKQLTSEDVALLISENWLTSQQQNAFNIYEGIVKTREEIETLCPDQIVLNSIFKEIEVDNIQYSVHCYFYGESTFLETFNDIKDAILAREKLIESIRSDNVRIEVSYNLV